MLYCNISYCATPCHAMQCSAMMRLVALVLTHGKATTSNGVVTLWPVSFSLDAYNTNTSCRHQESLPKAGRGVHTIYWTVHDIA